MHISHFRKIAESGNEVVLLDGTAKKEQREELKTASLKGRIVRKVRGEAAGRNAEVKEAFLKAAKRAFGEEASDRMRAQIGPADKPLTARVIREALRAGDASLAKNLERNAGVAKRLATEMDREAPRSFGHTFDRVAQRLGFEVEPRSLNFDLLRRDIEKKVVEAGDNGRKALGWETAQPIAEARIEKFIERKQALLEKISTIDATEREKGILVDFAMSHEISEPGMLDHLLEIREAAGSLLSVLGSPEASRSDKLGALVQFQGDYDRAMGRIASSMSRDEFGADNLIEFASNSLELAMELSGTTSPQARDLYVKLTAPEIGELREGAVFLYQNTVELEIGTESASKLRTVNDLLGAAIRLAGIKAGVDPERIRTDNHPPSRLRNVDAIAPDIIGKLSGIGFADVHYSIDRMFSDLPGGPSKAVLETAYANLLGSREVLSGSALERVPPDRQYALCFEQVEVLLEHCGRIDRLVDSESLMARSVIMQQALTEVVDLLGRLGGLASSGGGDNEATILKLETVQRLIDSFVDRGLPDPLRRSAEGHRTAIQSEIYTRRDPKFKELDSGDQLQMIHARRETGKVVSEALGEVFAQRLDAGELLEIRERSSRILEGMERLSGRMKERPGALGNAAERIDSIRVGSSDTIAGKSGVEGLQDGAAIALRNWKEAATLAGRIAEGGSLITLDQIKEINRILNRDLPANEGEPGEFRTRPETAGGGAQYPAPEHIGRLMGEFMEWMRQSVGSLAPVELAGLAYQKLVSIHPFADANGRTCRLVVDCLLQQAGLPPASYEGSDEFNVAVFGVPQGKSQNITGTEAMRRVATAVERSLSILQEELGDD